MENNKKEYKSTIHAFITAKQEIEVIINNAEAFKFKYADLVAVQKEVNRVIKGKGLDIVGTEHIEYENKYNEKLNNYFSKGIFKIEIGSIWDNERLTFTGAADFSNKTPHDAGHSSNSIGYRYALLRAFGIPTMDENDARLKDKIEQEKAQVKKSLSNPDSVLTQFASDSILEQKGTINISGSRSIQKTETQELIKNQIIKDIQEKLKIDNKYKQRVKSLIIDKNGNIPALSSLTIEQLKELL